MLTWLKFRDVCKNDKFRRAVTSEGWKEGVECDSRWGCMSFNWVMFCFSSWQMGILRLNHMKLLMFDCLDLQKH